LLLLLAGCTTCKGVKTSSNGGEPPVILDSYDTAPIRPGTSWRVFLKAEDPDDDIHYIAAQLWQPGVGYYPASFNYIEGAEREGFEGYIFLKTPVDRTLLPDTFHLEVLLRDCEGNASEPVRLTLKFDLRSNYAVKPVPEKWQTAAKRKLGSIQVEIISSHRYNSGDGNDRGKFVP
jgi:hypothetical protein